MVSQGAFVAWCAVQGGGASPCAVERTSPADCGALLPSCAESMTRAGVTPITLVGGASNSDPTLQLIASVRPTREASLPRFVRIDCRHANARSIPGAVSVAAARRTGSDAAAMLHRRHEGGRGATCHDFMVGAQHAAPLLYSWRRVS